eukprot:6478664-Amphidinium_carterae.3
MLLRYNGYTMLCYARAARCRGLSKYVTQSLCNVLALQWPHNATRHLRNVYTRARVPQTMCNVFATMATKCITMLLGPMPRGKIPPGFLIPVPGRARSTDDECQGRARSTDDECRTPLRKRQAVDSVRPKFGAAGSPVQQGWRPKLAPGGASENTRSSTIGRGSGTDDRGRHDVPQVKPCARTSQTEALRVYSDVHALDRAVQNYRDDVNANSSRMSQQSLLRTWSKFAEKAVGRNIWPLTPSLIELVAAGFKAGHYRSYANYAAQAKLRHIEFGYEWTQALDLALKRSVRSCKRGMGPGKQSRPIDITHVIGQADAQPLVQDGPIGFANLLIVAVFHMLREIEVSALKVMDVKLRHDTQVESLYLSVSKTDPCALGCWRSWGCICEGKRDWHCPYHAIVHQLELLAAMYAVDVDAVPRHSPLFPTLAGCIASKEKVIESTRAWCHNCGMHDTLTVTGHTFRVTGAQHLAQRGIDIPTIMVMARWKSNIVLHYAQEAPLMHITEKYRRGVVPVTSEPILPTSLLARDEMEAELNRVKKEVSKLRSRTPDAMEYVLNEPTKP